VKVLIVEDEAGICKFLEQGLSEEGFSVSVAYDGETALDQIEKNSFDIILLDWMLPGISGPEVCKIIRSKGIFTPVIFLTARDTVSDTIDGLRSGANDYIRKPFSFEELLERIHVQLRSNAEVHSVLNMGDIKIDRTAHLVFNGGDEVHLTQKEYELLSYLILNKGKVCTRKEIIEQIWDIHFDYDTGVIDVFINGIRKKLNLDKETGFLQTIRGAGYLVREVSD
jgi:DNA-binding response OmpR family regulator